MGIYQDNLNYWSFRGKSSKGKAERAAAKQIHDIMKHHGEYHQDRAIDELRSIRDKYKGNILMYAYQRGMEHAEKVLSVTHGTPSRNKARRCKK
jgi:hypothetical protein